MDEKKRQVRKDEMIEIIEHYEKKIEYLYERIEGCEHKINNLQTEINMLKRWRG